MIRHAFILGIVVVVNLCIASSGNAVLLDYEGFNYPTGELDGNDGWGASAGVRIESGSLSYPGLTAEGNHVSSGQGLFSERPFGHSDLYTTAGTYYWVFAGQVDSLVGGLPGESVPESCQPHAVCGQKTSCADRDHTSMPAATPGRRNHRATWPRAFCRVPTANRAV